MPKQKAKINNSTHKGITLIALVITNIVPYDKIMKCCNL